MFMMTWNSTRNTVRKLKKDLKSITRKQYPYIPLEVIEDLCKQLSPEAAKDIMENGYKNGELIYSKLKTETLAEIIGPEAKALIVGTGKGTRVFIDDVTD